MKKLSSLLFVFMSVNVFSQPAGKELFVDQLHMSSDGLIYIERNVNGASVGLEDVNLKLLKIDEETYQYVHSEQSEEAKEFNLRMCEQLNVPPPISEGRVVTVGKNAVPIVCGSHRNESLNQTNSLRRSSYPCIAELSSVEHSGWLQVGDYDTLFVEYMMTIPGMSNGSFSVSASSGIGCSVSADGHGNSGWEHWEVLGSLCRATSPGLFGVSASASAGAGWETCWDSYYGTITVDP